MTELLVAWYDRAVLRAPRLLLAVLAVLLVVSALGARRFELDASADALLLENDADLRAWREVSERYGVREFLFVALVPKGGLVDTDTLHYVATLEDALARLPGVASITSLLDVPLVRNRPGSLVNVAENMRFLRDDDVDPARAREELTTSPIYADLVASADGKVTAMQIFLAAHPAYDRLRADRDRLVRQRAEGGLNAAGEAELAALLPRYAAAKRAADRAVHETLAAIRATLDAHHGEHGVFLGGVPMIADDMLGYIATDLTTFGAGVVIFLVVMLSVIFREVRWVALPFASCVYAGLSMLGLLGWLDWKVTVISSNFVALMLITTMSMNLHLVVRYREIFRDHPAASQYELTRRTVREMFLPCFYTAFTTVIAFTSLVVSDIKPVIDFGWMMVLGLAVLFVTSFTLFPALLVLLPRRPLRRPGWTTPSRPCSARSRRMAARTPGSRRPRSSASRPCTTTWSASRSSARCCRSLPGCASPSSSTAASSPPSN